jgi:hypothetical protein
MTSSDTIVRKALSSLGKGFDLTSDFRLKYCKGDDRLVMLNETENAELHVPGFGHFNAVSVDIKCDKGDSTRYQSDILNFNQMSEMLNQKSSVAGKIPTGYFNSMFGLESGSWGMDAGNIKYLALDGYFITLANLHIDRYPLLLSDEVRNAVPSNWDPSALARFIEKYGTHIIVGVSIGGQDVLLVRQDKSSNLDSSHLRNHLHDLGNQHFTASCTFHPNKSKNKASAFKPLQYNSASSSMTTQDGIKVISAKRGGDLSAHTHCEWLPTVASKPDAINFNFIPITSLLKGVPGKGFLSHAINLYLRYKPPISDLHYFLDFQTHKMWAPVHNDLTLGPTTNRPIPTSALQFNLMGPTLHVNTAQVSVGKRPITGMRLYLEGMKCNRLAVHLQHLSNTPLLFENRIQEGGMWQGSDEVGDHRYYEPIQWRKFSHVCTTPVKYNPDWSTANRKDVTFIVTGAQLQVKKHDSKTVLHLRLLYSKLYGTCIAQSQWMRTSSSSDNSQKSGFFSALSMSLTGGMDKDKTPEPVVVDSSVYPSGPPVPVQGQKLLKFVDMSQLCRGPSDSPGHWLVTGAKLELEKGKICLHVKFSLLNIC